MKRAGDYLSSTGNLFGMSFALAGMGAVLAGVVGSGWPLIVGGLYALGVLVDVARPRRADPPLGDGDPASSFGPLPGAGPDPDPDQPGLRPPAVPGPLAVPPPPPPVTPSPQPATRPSELMPGPSLPVPDLGIVGLSDLAVLGRGGFSTVYVGRDEGFNRLVAVKVLHDLDDNGRRWFDRERAIMGQLSDHPHIITPFRLGRTASGAPYMVMEYVPGGSLDDLLARRGPLPWPEVLVFGVQMCDALDHAHQAGIIHRDVKPANILLARRGAKLTDFGIASIRSATATASEIALTLAHCPPEAFASGTDERDERSDVYSLASTLYTVLSGRPPFDLPPDADGFRSPDTTPAYLQRITGHPVPRLAPDAASPALDDLLQVALAKNPANRPDSAAAFGAALAGIPAPGAFH